MDTPSSIVIKVKYGRKRHNFRVDVKGKKLALNFTKLREKIRKLFGFGSDVVFELSYVDEDGDNVNLVHDNDLRDIMRQQLKSLMITVKLTNSIVIKVQYRTKVVRLRGVVEDGNMVLVDGDVLTWDVLNDRIYNDFMIHREVSLKLDYLFGGRRVLITSDADLRVALSDNQNPLEIRVKCGKKLQCFSVLVVDGNELALDYAMLREKIHSLFSFGSDVVFNLTYVDEYGDNVLILRDDDLCDIVEQHLNPLMITVKHL